jgi:hypothetical protein
VTPHRQRLALLRPDTVDGVLPKTTVLHLVREDGLSIPRDRPGAKARKPTLVSLAPAPAVRRRAEADLASGGKGVELTQRGKKLLSRHGYIVHGEPRLYNRAIS